MRGNQSEATHARMLELIEQIKKADTAYYRDDRPILSDREYDLLVEKLEQKLGATTFRSLMDSRRIISQIAGSTIRAMP